LVDLKRIYEDLTHCACVLNNVISYLKVKERSLKVNNNKFRANVARLEMTLKIAQVEVGQEENIKEEISVL